MLNSAASAFPAVCCMGKQANHVLDSFLGNRRFYGACSGESSIIRHTKWESDVRLHPVSLRFLDPALENEFIKSNDAEMKIFNQFGIVCAGRFARIITPAPRGH